ncbi:MAG: hypothetical protein MRJ68_10910 [Nitrospira sp.]|nr:hypothetical protein [Nitrospira sp.]
MRGLKNLKIVEDATEVLPGLGYKPELLSIFLARGNSLGTSGSQTLSAILRDGAVDNGAAIDTLPGIEDEKEIREPL